MYFMIKMPKQLIGTPSVGICALTLGGVQLISHDIEINVAITATFTP